MGRRPTIPGGLPNLTPRQREMLMAVLGTGRVSHFLTQRADSAWAVRIYRRGTSSYVYTYPHSAGRRLLELGYLAPDPDPKRAEARNSAGKLIGRRYVPTDAAFERMASK